MYFLSRKLFDYGIVILCKRWSTPLSDSDISVETVECPVGWFCPRSTVIGGHMPLVPTATPAASLQQVSIANHCKASLINNMFIIILHMFVQLKFFSTREL